MEVVFSMFKEIIFMEIYQINYTVGLLCFVTSDLLPPVFTLNV